MYPDRDTLNNVPRSGYIAARDQSMVESGVTEGGKNTTRLPVFFFVNEQNSTNTKRLGKHQDSRENKTNCFPRDLTLSV